MWVSCKPAIVFALLEHFRLWILFFLFLFFHVSSIENVVSITLCGTSNHLSCAPNAKRKYAPIPDNIKTNVAKSHTKSTTAMNRYFMFHSFRLLASFVRE